MVARAVGDVLQDCAIIRPRQEGTAVLLLGDAEVPEAAEGERLGGVLELPVLGAGG